MAVTEGLPYPSCLFLVLFPVLLSSLKSLAPFPSVCIFPVVPPPLALFPLPPSIPLSPLFLSSLLPSSSQNTVESRTWAPILFSHSCRFPGSLSVRKLTFARLRAPFRWIHSRLVTYLLSKRGYLKADVSMDEIEARDTASLLPSPAHSSLLLFSKIGRR